MIYNQVGHMREKQWISYENICKSGIQSYVYDYDFNNLINMNKWVYKFACSLILFFNFKVIIKSDHDWP